MWSPPHIAADEWCVIIRSFTAELEKHTARGDDEGVIKSIRDIIDYSKAAVEQCAGAQKLESGKSRCRQKWRE